DGAGSPGRRRQSAGPSRHGLLLPLEEADLERRAPPLVGKASSGRALPAPASRAVVLERQSGGRIHPHLARAQSAEHAGLFLSPQLHQVAARQTPPDEPRSLSGLPAVGFALPADQPGIPENPFARSPRSAGDPSEL